MSSQDVGADADTEAGGLVIGGMVVTAAPLSQQRQRQLHGPGRGPGRGRDTGQEVQPELQLHEDCTHSSDSSGSADGTTDEGVLEDYLQNVAAAVGKASVDRMGTPQGMLGRPFGASTYAGCAGASSPPGAIPTCLVSARMLALSREGKGAHLCYAHGVRQ
jgi:hypothetical protein